MGLVVLRRELLLDALLELAEDLLERRLALRARHRRRLGHGRLVGELLLELLGQVEELLLVGEEALLVEHRRRARCPSGPAPPRPSASLPRGASRAPRRRRTPDRRSAPISIVSAVGAGRLAGARRCGASEGLGRAAPRPRSGSGAGSATSGASGSAASSPNSSNAWRTAARAATAGPAAAARRRGLGRAAAGAGGAAAAVAAPQRLRVLRAAGALVDLRELLDLLLRAPGSATRPSARPSARARAADPGAGARACAAARRPCPPARTARRPRPRRRASRPRALRSVAPEAGGGGRGRRRRRSRPGGGLDAPEGRRCSGARAGATSSSISTSISGAGRGPGRPRRRRARARASRAAASASPGREPQHAAVLIDGGLQVARRAPLPGPRRASSAAASAPLPSASRTSAILARSAAVRRRPPPESASRCAAARAKSFAAAARVDRPAGWRQTRVDVALRQAHARELDAAGLVGRVEREPLLGRPHGLGRLAGLELRLGEQGEAVGRGRRLLQNRDRRGGVLLSEQRAHELFLDLEVARHELERLLEERPPPRRARRARAAPSR